MAGQIFIDTLRRDWRPAVYWAVALALYAAYVMFLMPDIEGLQGYVDLINLMPPALLAMIGLTDVSTLATPEGFLGFTFFGYGAVVLAIYAVLAGLSVTANDEETGALDMLLALPLPRWRVIVERVAAHALLTPIITVGAWLGLATMQAFNPAAAGLDAGRLLVASMAAVPLVLAVMAVTVLLTSVIRRRTVAAATAGGFVAVSYLLNAMAGVAGAELGAWMRRVSIFSYYDGAEVSRSGPDVVALMMLTALAAALTAAAIARFDRRDIGN